MVNSANTVRKGHDLASIACSNCHQVAVDQAAVRRLFGTALDALPDPGMSFLLYFDEARYTLNSEAQAAAASIVRAVQDRHSTDVSVTGHTDRTGSAAENYRLGLRRAERVAEVLRRQGVDVSSLFVSSHGSAILKKRKDTHEPCSQ